RIERDCLRQRRQVKTQLDLHAVAGQQCDVVLPLACETVVRGGNPITSWWQRGEAESSFAIRVCLAVDAGIDVRDRDPGGAEDLAVHVADASPDLSGIPLRERRRAAEKRKSEQQRGDQGSVHLINPCATL